MKRILSVTMAFVILFSGIKMSRVHADSTVNIVANDEKMTLKSQVIVEKENIFLPLREVSEKLGYDISWEQEKKTIVLKTDEDVAELQIGSKEIVHNKTKNMLKVAPIIKADVTYVPIEFFGNHLNTVVSWDPGENKVAINVKKEPTEDFFQKTEEKTIASNLEKYLETYVEKQNFQGSVLLAKGDKVLFDGGYGYSNEKLGIQNNSQTKHAIGSMTKQFVATGIMQLVEQGKVQTEDTVGKYIDGLKYGKDITLHQLLTHTSGLVNVTEVPEFYALTDSTPQKVIDLIKDKKLAAKPGENFVYNNTNYILLGMVIEKVTGETLEDYFEKNIFEPLNMKDTGVAYGKHPGFHIATPHQGYIEQVEADDKPLLANIYGAGNIYSTVEDMYRWSKALDGEKVLSKESKKKMFQGNTVQGKNTGYGYGWVVGKSDEGTFYQHDGSTLGFGSVIYKNVEKDLSIIILSNRRLTDVYSVAYGLESIALGNKLALEEIPEFPKEISVDAKELENYTGTYKVTTPVNNEKMDIFVSREKDKLFIQFPQQEKFQIYPEGNNKFFSKLVEVDISFELNAEGKAKKITYSQMGVSYKGPHEKYGEEVTIEDGVLEKYVGTYGFQEGFDLTITKKEGKLFAQVTGQDSFELSAVSKTKFEYLVLDASMEFQVEEDGNVKQLLFKQAGQELNGTKK